MNEDLTVSATRGDVLLVKNDVTELRQLISEMKQQFAAMNKMIDRRFDRIHEDIDKVLLVLVNVDKRAKSTGKDHERRIVRLERHAGLAA